MANQTNHPYYETDRQHQISEMKLAAVKISVQQKLQSGQITKTDARQQLRDAGAFEAEIERII